MLEWNRDHCISWKQSTIIELVNLDQKYFDIENLKKLGDKGTLITS